MGEEESSITLNIKSSSNDEVKKRKAEHDTSDGTPAKKRRPAKDHQGQKKDQHGKPREDTDFISSLFNHNPEIPKIEFSEDVKPVKEDVFADSDFDSSVIHPYLIQNLKQNCNISRMTSVQVKSIPVILAGKDALVKSQTGSGKTLAFALPILHMLQAIRPEVTRDQGVFALVVVPTRELAIQCLELFDKLCKSFARIVPGVLSGGEKKKSEKARLRKGINILIATPGRLVDHLKTTKCLNLKNLRFLVLDEADRMLELGYERDVQSIVTVINEQRGTDRQTLLLSATLTTGIEQLSEVSMKHPKFIDAAVDEDKAEEALKTLTTPQNLTQTFIVAPAKLRLVSLASFVLWKCRFAKARKLLIFMSTQDMIDFHAELFELCLNSAIKPTDTNSSTISDLEDNVEWEEGSKELLTPTTSKSQSPAQPSKIKLLKLHGSMTQSDRLKVFSEFREAKAGVLLCTDVAARGLDLPQVDWIVQYNAPLSKADYVHRVGRTARIGAKGSSLLFLLPSEANFVKKLEEEKIVLAEMTIEQILEKLLKNSEPSLKTGRYPTSLEEAATNLQMRFENAILANKTLHEQSSAAYVSYIRSYSSYPREVRDVFCFKDLHLGHLAKSFALRDPPSKITGIGKKAHWIKTDERKREHKHKEKQEEKIINAQKKRINQKQLILSEYSSGFDGIAPPAKKVIRKPGRKFVRHPRK